MGSILVAIMCAFSREVYQEEDILSTIQTEHDQRKEPHKIQKLSVEVDDILKKSLAGIENENDYTKDDDNMDLFSLIEEGFSGSDSSQGTLDSFPEERENTHPVAKRLSLVENGSFDTDKDCVESSRIFSPGFSDRLLSSGVSHATARNINKLYHSNRTYRKCISSQLR